MLINIDLIFITFITFAHYHHPSSTLIREYLPSIPVTFMEENKVFWAATPFIQIFFWQAATLPNFCTFQQMFPKRKFCADVSNYLSVKCVLLRICSFHKHSVQKPSTLILGVSWFLLCPIFLLKGKSGSSFSIYLTAP